MHKPLNKRQEIFAQEIAKGKKQLEAYRIAYPNNKGTDKSVTESASRMAKNPNVQSRIKELNRISLDVAEKQFSYTVEDGLRLDFELVNDYLFQKKILQNPKSTKRQVEVAKRVIAVIGISGYNAAQERIAKRLGHYEKDKPIVNIGEVAEVVNIYIPSNGRG